MTSGDVIDESKIAAKFLVKFYLIDPNTNMKT